MLKGTKVNIRFVKESDLDTYIRYSQDLELRGEYFPWNILTDLAIRNRFKENGLWDDNGGIMLMVDPVSDQMVGLLAAFKPLPYYSAFEIGYILHDTTRRGEGITLEAVNLFCRFLFRWKPITRIQIQADTPNTASRRVAEKAGFTHEGTMRGCTYMNGVARDLEMYSLLVTECP